jgi:hypothetical protein
MAQNRILENIAPLFEAIAKDFNGARVDKGTDGKTLFIPLPEELWRSTGCCCNCEHCKGRFSFWDTLAVSPDQRYSWIVHRPETHGI